jgi:hypothetical protein
LKREWNNFSRFQTKTVLGRNRVQATTKKQHRTPRWACTIVSLKPATSSSQTSNQPTMVNRSSQTSNNKSSPNSKSKTHWAHLKTQFKCLSHFRKVRIQIWLMEHSNKTWISYQGGSIIKIITPINFNRWVSLIKMKNIMCRTQQTIREEDPV